jgi:hypothetical protein
MEYQNESNQKVKKISYWPNVSIFSKRSISCAWNVAQDSVKFHIRLFSGLRIRDEEVRHDACVVVCYQHARTLKTFGLQDQYVATSIVGIVCDHNA